MTPAKQGCFPDRDYMEPMPFFARYLEPVLTPHRCPVCEGKGLVPNGFYLAVGVTEYTTSSMTPETCRSCDGKGIVWR